MENELSIENRETKFWLISVLMITKQNFKLIIISQMWLGKEISKVTVTKTKLSQREFNKKKTSKISVFQDLNFIGSLCNVVGALSFLCITLLIYAPKLFKSNFVLNPLKLDDFIF